MREPSESDRKVIARLAKALGRDVVCAIAKTLPLPKGRGRPADDLEKKFIKIATTLIIEDALQFSTLTGCPATVRDVAGEYFQGDADVHYIRMSKRRDEGYKLLAQYRHDPRFHKWMSKLVERSEACLIGSRSEAPDSDEEQLLGVMEIMRHVLAEADHE